MSKYDSPEALFTQRASVAKTFATSQLAALSFEALGVAILRLADSDIATKRMIIINSA